MPVGLDTRPLELAADRAIDVGARLLRQRGAHLHRVYGNAGNHCSTEVDPAIERAMRTALREAAPEVGVLGEEGRGDGDGPTWVLGPIDGRVNFARGGLLCALSLALIVEGQAHLGIVDAPLLGERFRTRAGHGAWCNGRRMRVSDPRVLHEAIVGLSDPKVGRGAAEENAIHLALVTELATRCLCVRMHGSAALDLAWLAAGRLNATVMLSNLPCDVTAGLLLVREAGGCAFDLDGADHDAGSRFSLASAPSLKGDLCDLMQAASRRRTRR